MNENTLEEKIMESEYLDYTRRFDSEGWNEYLAEQEDLYWEED